MSRILFNDLVTLRERSGVGSYAAELAANFPAESIVRLSETLAGLPLRQLAKRPPKTSQGKGRLHEVLQRWLSVTTSLGDYSLYHEPDALPFPSSLPTIATVHDLSVTLFPEWHPSHRVERYRRELPRVLEQTRGFLADSYATARDMQTYWQVPEEKIQVVWLAPRPAFRPALISEVAAVQRQLGLPAHYFLFLGTMEPRKNVRGLLNAHHALPEKTREKFPLVFAGGSGWGESSSAGSRYLGYLDDKTLVPLLCGATALVYPSFYEGFGLPPVEAMACGVPVISSHCGSLKEVVEDAALVIDPKEPAQLTQAMAGFADKPALREEYVVRGTKQAAKFSWKKTAEQTLAAYRRWSV